MHSLSIGLEENSMENGLEENVAVIGFGNQPKNIQHFTNDYSRIRAAMSKEFVFLLVHKNLENVSDRQFK